MWQQKFLSKGITSALGLWLFLLAGLPLLGNTTEKEKGLFYYVVDRSGSITTYGLTEPIRRAITEHAAQLPEDTEVRLIFFSRQASEPARWERMTPEAKADFATYFADNFVPDGPTRLYDTVGEVMEEIRASSEHYRFVSVLIFSDGENNWSRKFKSWNDLESTHASLIDRHEQSRIYWITLEFDPAEKAPSWVNHEPQPPGTREIPIPEPPPQADFAANPLQLRVGEEVRFEYSAKGGPATTFEWAFGDGSTSAEQDPIHSYERDGSYTVTLRTTGPGGKAQETRTNFIEVAPVIPLTASFRFSPDRPRIGDTLQLQDISGGNPDGRQWKLDGEVISDEVRPSISIERAGEMMLTLTVTRGSEQNEVTQVLRILPPAPPAGFSISPGEADFGETIFLAAEETESDWEHGWVIDGEITLQGAEVEWISDRHGLMHVVHTVDGPGGLSRHSDRMFIHPQIEIVPSAAFAITPRVFTEGDTVILSANETNEDWIHEWFVAGKSVGEGPVLDWESNQVGNILVTHRIRIPDIEAIFEASDELLARPHELVRVSFSASRLSGAYPLEVGFKDESVGRAVAYRWDFGDGNFSNERSPTHTYGKDGDYAVTLSVTNPQGITTANVDPVILSVRPPMPYWQKLLFGFVGAGLVWVFLIVPLILRPMLGPQKGPKLIGIKTYPLYLTARRGLVRFFWPKTSVTVGSASHSDIRLRNGSSSRANYALIERAPAASNYTIRPAKKKEIFRIEHQASLMNPEAEIKARITRARMLKDGDTYEIGGERLVWCQPEGASVKNLRRKKQLQKKKASLSGRPTLAKVRN